MHDGLGDRFQKETKYYRESLEGGMLDWSTKPEIYKEYPKTNKISLPKYEPIGSESSLTLYKVLSTRKSIRNFTQELLSQEHLSYLLWASTGIQREEGGYEFRTAPSAGALYPIETYLVVNKVEELEQGVYHYSIKNHLLEEIKLGNFSREVALAGLGQRMCMEAAVVFVWSAIFYRSKWKYKQRGYRYIYLDAGHIAENLALTATSLGLGSCQIGAIFDDDANKILDLDGTNESVIYMTVIGHPR